MPKTIYVLLVSVGKKVGIFGQKVF